ncbi:gamma carbonic anhydrase family protein [Reichenbachiella ulvae]|uniref:Gamma carbonic anhydrase family protein n=1 Tax=Reichenbachiella ulvae TaxID=2980104 RepID=A0ABT3CRF8_9BACT|nr:gamma carbonic anhydrase family protein [Reichenbachiella ulvae]MCV9386197.1 gamma carbonic anhydrase family protein [Reichenbachiella ulvae]
MALIRELLGKTPAYGKDCWFAETAVVIGDVTMGDNCSIWYNAVLRGDVHSITIGHNSNVQDNAMIHCTYQKAPTVIGNHVSIGHNAIVHGCTLEDNVLIGMGAIVMDHAVIGSGSIIGAGAVVLENTIVEPGSVYVGNPARKVKDIGDKGTAEIQRIAGNYLKYSSWYKES